MPSTLLQRISTPSAATTSDHHTKHHHHHHFHPLPTLPYHLTQQLHTLSPTDYSIIFSHHTHPHLSQNQTTSALIHRISAPLEAVWSVIRQFDNPLPYKHFLKSCHLVHGDGVSAGSLREVRVVSGLPAESSIERLEILDDERHVISFRVVGGEHRLTNYRSVTTLHEVEEETVVVESYVVDVPAGNTKEETTTFADTIVRCNLQALAQVTQRKSGHTITTTSRKK